MNGKPGPLKVGNEYETRIDFTETSDVPPKFSENGAVAKLDIMKYKGGPYITVHFAEFDLANGCVAKISGINNIFEKSQRYEMTGKGKMDAGTFWT